MQPSQKRLLFFLFFLSGFCGLLYQIVWMRICFAHFGVITPVLSVVLSVFMFGLFVGSWAAGRIVKSATRVTGFSAIYFYALAEFLIGVGAFAVPYFFARGESALLNMGASDSFPYLLASSLVIAAAIFPWCVFMGTTFPFMMAFVKEREGGENTSFSFLYLANVIGAMVGTLVSALVLIEALGFKNTLLVGAMANGLVGIIAILMGVKAGKPLVTKEEEKVAVTVGSSRLLVFLFATGFTSMAMEVVWTRAFTPVLKTQVYSFAGLLFVYLLATWVGSLKYRKHLKAGVVRETSLLISLLAVSALFPIVFNDPRLRLGILGVVIGIFPFCALLGYMTPKLIDNYSKGSPDAAGFSYAINTLGCILGPLIASYLLLPWIGVKYSLLLLAIPYALFLVFYFPTSKKPIATFAVLLVASIIFFQTYEERFQARGEVRRDHTATVIAVGQGMEKQLLVNGIGITFLTTLTKVMAHLPLSFFPEKPKSALVICFGMGTTFRSLLSWGLDTTAVELVPSVRDSFPYFFADANELIKQPNARIVIDDGRRFLKRTNQKFDLITLDPPPPIEAAGSSLLYSEQFYHEMKDHLTHQGILQQWFPGGEEKTQQAIARSLYNVFPYVKVFKGLLGGNHFIASLRPLEVPSVKVMASRMPEAARKDLMEWEGDNLDAMLSRVLSLEISPDQISTTASVRVTDDQPYNEYFLLRRFRNYVDR
jgi:spermidine synthase